MTSALSTVRDGCEITQVDKLKCLALEQRDAILGITRNGSSFTKEWIKFDYYCILKHVYNATCLSHCKSRTLCDQMYAKVHLVTTIAKVAYIWSH